MINDIQVKAFLRGLGKHHVRSLRNEKKIPAIVYGPKIKNIPFYISELDAVKLSGSKFSNAVLTLKSEDKNLNGIKVLQKKMTIHPVSRRPVHIDYYAIDMTQTVRINVQIEFTGKSKGEEDGGIFNTTRREVEVECLPTNIPENFIVDISKLEMNQSLTVADIEVSESYKILVDLSETIATISQPKEEEEPVAAAAPEGEAEGATAAAPEGEDKKNKDEGGEAGGDKK